MMFIFEIDDIDKKVVFFECIKETKGKRGKKTLNINILLLNTN